MKSYLIIATLTLTGCANPAGIASKEMVDTAFKTPPSPPAPLTPPPAAVQQAILDSVHVSEPATNIASKPHAEPRFNLTVNNAKAAEVFMGMVSGTPYSMLVHPDVTGTLTLNLKNVTVPEAMEAIRSLYGYEYEVQGTRIIVPSPTLQTRLYHLNALAMQRKGASDMRVVSGSVSLSNVSGGGNATGTVSASKSLETSSVQTSTDSKYWDEVNTTLKSLVGEGGSVVVSPQSGVIVVKAAPASLAMVERYLHATELATNRQIMLEAKILDVQLNDGFQSGVNWATLQNGGKTAIGQNSLNPDGTTTVNLISSVTNMLTGAIPGTAGNLFGAAFNDGNFGAVISLIQSQGAVHVLSSPRIATINNQKAVLKVGKDNFFVTEVTGGTVATQYSAATPPNVVLQPFFSGIALDVTPQIDDKDNVTLHVRPSVSDVTSQTQTIDLGTQGTYTLPLAASSISETDSVVRLKDGQIVAIGGLMSQAADDTKSRLPLLGDIPVLGQLFGNTSQTSQKRELVVLIKATLIRDSQDWERDLEDTQRRFQVDNPDEKQP